MNIHLHKTKGVNPHLTFCRRCGRDGNELILLGTRDYKTQCPNCNTMNYGSSPRDKCGKCKKSMHNGKKESIEEYERLPSGDICDNCKKELDNTEAIVIAGGIYFKCSFGCEGAIPDCEFTKDFRKDNNIPTPEKVGVEFDADNCPNKENHK